MEHELVILSPEKTILTYRLASVGSRILAHVLDVLIAVGIIIIFERIGQLIATTSPVLDPIIQAARMFVLTAVPFLYFMLLEGLWNGQTIGKKAVGLRVRMADGTPVTFTAALGRNLLRPADILPGTYFVGLLAMFTTPKSQRLEDLVADTVVVHEKRAIPMFAPAPHSAGIHPLNPKSAICEA